MPKYPPYVEQFDLNEYRRISHAGNTQKCSPASPGLLCSALSLGKNRSEEVKDSQLVFTSACKNLEADKRQVRT